MPADALPTFKFFSHFTSERLPLDWLEAKANGALVPAIASPGPHPSCLSDLGIIEVNLVNDVTIGKIHAEFLDDPSPTDVITFHHGEIFVSVETAARVGPPLGNSEAEETLLYLIHGLLHLNGHDDHELSERDAMHELQEKILREILN
ncbi:MAG: rRNA maturation RNase YbeY [Verrucomicrobiota bacterium]